MPPLTSSTASFRTHLNYIKCLERLLSSCALTVSPRGTFTRQDSEVRRFVRLYKLTVRSIEKDYELAREDPAIAVILAPWFPVKCYYALYYLESILLHLTDGGMHGYGKGGHSDVRKMMGNHVTCGAVTFSSSEINTVYVLEQIGSLPTTVSGGTTTLSYWASEQCVHSIAKKLLEYKLHNAKTTSGWDFRTNVGRNARDQYLRTKKLMLLDFFYWYRIKANYRDLDYIDFENGISDQEIFEYLESYFEAFKAYSNLLGSEVNRLLRIP